MLQSFFMETACIYLLCRGKQKQYVPFFFGEMLMDYVRLECFYKEIVTP